MIKTAKGGYKWGDYTYDGSYVATSSNASGALYGYSAIGATYDGHSSNWKFVTEAKVNFTAKSMTEYGALVGYVQLIGAYDPTNDHVNVDEAYLQLGHVLLGHTGSVQNQSGGFAPGLWRPDDSTNQIQLQWAAAGFGVYLGIEDPRERWGTELPTNYSMPDIVGAITFSGGHWSGKITAGWADLAGGGVYGVTGQLTANIDAIGAGSKVRVGGAFGTGSRFVGIGSGNPFYNYQNNWTAYISALWQATPTVGLAGTFAYGANESWSATSGGAKLIWTPVAGFEAYVEGKAWKWENDSEHNWEATVGFVRSW